MARILVVDDDPQVARALGRLLRRSGYEVELAETGADALLKIPTFLPDAVISDFRMPGMTGAEMLAMVRERHPLTLRIILSGFADLRSILSSINEGEICRFLTKPWDDDQLVLLLRRLLTEREVLMALYEPFSKQSEEISSVATQQELKLLVTLRKPGPFTPAQVMTLLSSFTGMLNDEFEAVGSLLQSHSGSVSLVAHAGAEAELKLEVPLTNTLETETRT